MFSHWRAALLFTTSLGLLTPTLTVRLAAQTFQNPLFAGQDPYVTFWNGSYYYTESGTNQIKIRKSATLSGLKAQNDHIAWTSPWEGPDGHANLWAPEIHQINGIWYIYYSADFDSSGRHHLYVLRGGADPMGPYQVANTGYPNGQLVESTGKWAIDPDVFYGADGQLYLTWSCTADETGTPPQKLCLARMSDALHISSATSEISSPILPWETRSGPINEGPVGFVHNGKTYLTYSASASWTPNDYTVGVLVGSGGDLLDPKTWAKHGPVFDHHGTAYGPGSVVFVTSPDGSELWNVYHAYDSLNCATWACRSIRMQKVVWDAADLPLLGYPVNPTVETRMPSGESGSLTGWGNSPLGTAATGSWTYTSASNLETMPGNTAPIWKTFRDNTDPISYTVTAAIQVDGGGSGQFGLYPIHHDESNYVAVYLDFQQGMLVSDEILAGASQGQRTYPFAANFDPAAVHTILVTKSSNGLYSLFLDGVFVDSRTVGIGFGQTGVFGSGPGGHFTNFAVTDTSFGWTDAYGDAAEGLTRGDDSPVPCNGYVHGNWLITDGGTVQSSSAGDTWNRLYQGNPNFENYTVQVDAQLAAQGRPAAPPSFGLVVCHDDRNNQVSLWIDPMANVLKWNVVLAGQSTWQSAALPAGFDVMVSHRLAAVKLGFQFTFLLDGNQMAQETYAIPNGTSGVVTENAEVAFRNFSVIDQ